MTIKKKSNDKKDSLSQRIDFTEFLKENPKLKPKHKQSKYKK